MNLKYLLVVLFLLCTQFVSAQEDTLHVGIHQLESRQFRSRGDSVLLQQQPFLGRPSSLLTYKKLELSRKVFGWHPYWASASAYLSYDYNLLTHLSYFSYETDTVTGGYKTINGWDQTPIIDYAHLRGVKVLLTVTNFGTAANHAILRDTLKQIKMIQTITSLLKSRNGDGVNFDLELVSLTHRSDLVAFISRAAKAIRAEIPGAEISMATPAVDWNGSWDLPALAAICDYLIVMGYDYYWSGSTTAGPVSPMAGENYNVTKSVDTYLGAGVPPQKLMLGIPWFGYNWPVVSSDRKATATGKATSLTSVAADALALTYGKTFDQTTKVPWISYKDGSNLYRQIWYDDGSSYPIKFDLVNNRNLAGIGIWALSYENGKQDLWQGIQSAFSATAINDPVTIQKGSSDLVLFPNPVKVTGTIRFTLAERQIVDLSVVDLSGKFVVSILRKELPADNYTILFDCSHLKNQVYILVFKSTRGNLTRKFVVKNN
ncbi:MAG: glycosyl hydrolase family 18 protein [Bacteroidia bacterium]|nr:glycosyl hydrolase family 18 protein [Bacteroidia bacterium]